MIIEGSEIKNYMVMVDDTPVSLVVLVQKFREALRRVETGAEWVRRLEK